MQLLDAVAHCHAHGIIHRDIKPSNIFVEDDGGVRLIDFEVAARRGERCSLAGYEDTRVGTLPYSAPEQILDPPTATYETADIFSLGVVLYEMLTGRIPFDMREGEDEEAYRARLPFTDPVPPTTYRPDLPPEIEAVILKAMARDPSARHQSVAELRTELETAFYASASPESAEAGDGVKIAIEPARALATSPRRAVLLLLPLVPLLTWLFLVA